MSAEVLVVFKDGNTQYLVIPEVTPYIQFYRYKPVDVLITAEAPSPTAAPAPVESIFCQLRGTKPPFIYEEE